MSRSATMIDAHPRTAGVDTTLHSDTIDVLVDAALIARQCADACTHESEPMTECISATLDASDVASATAGVIIRLSHRDSAVAQLVACREVLRICAEECRRHGLHLRHCAACAEVCERAEDLCLQMETALSRRAGEHSGPALRSTAGDSMSPGATLGPGGVAAEPNEPA